jgi:hypothetical protein
MEVELVCMRVVALRKEIPERPSLSIQAGQGERHCLWSMSKKVLTTCRLCLDLGLPSL